MVYVFGFAAACLLGFGFVLQQHAAQRAPLSDMLSFRLLLDLIRIPQWLAGIGCMVIGQILGALALAYGDLSRVEPLLATNLLFAMALARWLGGQPLGGSGWSGVLALSGGVAAFILAGQPHSGAGSVGRLRYWLVFAFVLAIAGILVLIANRLELLHKPPLLAAAAGTLYGIQDALTRLSGGIIGRSGVLGLLTAWQPYVLITVAVLGLLLVQSAFEAGPLRLSLPALSAAEPLAGIVCGIGLLGDQLKVSPGALAWQAAGITAVVTGVFVLGRHPTMPTGERNPAATGRRPRSP